MPHHWAESPAPDQPLLTLWPHHSLPRRGAAAMVLFAFTAGTIPLYGLIGTVLFWGLLPFSLIAVGALWFGLRRSYRDGQILETLSLNADILEICHKPARGAAQEWSCNIYWVRTELHATGGPVPNYVTLSGNGRTVEIGRFLSEEERKALHGELLAFLQRTGATQQ
jgi:uncharacterized membrane protein